MNSNPSVLVLGGTQFVGRHIVESLLAKGAEVTLFHRGRTHPELFPDCKHVLGDRMTDLHRLGASTWDSVVDVSCYQPVQVKKALHALAGQTPHYLFISTISVYDFENLGTPVDENSKRYSPADNDDAEVTNATYGPLKVGCEDLLFETLGDRLTLLRPGIVVGPHDHTHRWSYWPHRIAKGGKFIAPGDPDQPMQFIDGRDLGGFAAHCVMNALTGTMNMVGPSQPMTFAEMLTHIANALGSDATPVWVSDADLEPENISLPMALGGRHNVFQVSNQLAMSHGLTHRPVEEIARDTVQWLSTLGLDRLPTGADPDAEQQLLERLATQ